MKEDKLNLHGNKESNLFITPPIVPTFSAAINFLPLSPRTTSYLDG